MQRIKVVKSEFEEWAKETPVIYASESVTRGDCRLLLRFWAYVDGGGYKVTLANKTIYEGGSFSVAADAFNSNV